MKEQKDNLEPETIDHVVEDGQHSQQDRQTARLIQHLHAGSQEYAQENERSLDRIWDRMVQSQEHSVFLRAQWKRPEEKYVLIKERKTMQENNESWGMNSPTPLSQPKKRNSLLRVVGISLVAAVVVVTILSFTVFSSVLRPAPQTTNGSSTTTGSSSQKQQQQEQKAISNGKLVCSFSAGQRVSINGAPWSPSLALSSQGQIAVATYTKVKAYSADNCSSTAFSQSSLQQTYGATWSPDGQKLEVSDAGDTTEYVLDSHGKIIGQWKNLHMSERIWSSDSKKLIFDAEDSKEQWNIKSLDVSDGGKITTLAQLPANTIVVKFSPDGRFALVSQLNKEQKRKDLAIWDINSAKKISELPSDTGGNVWGWTFSPDGSQIAIDGANSVQIYSTADGKLQTSFENKVSGQGVHSLEWSPDGKYIAESTNVIKVYDVSSKKIAATFGKVDDQHWISGLTWAPDSTKLATVSTLKQDGVLAEDMVSVWALS